MIRILRKHLLIHNHAIYDGQHLSPTEDVKWFKAETGDKDYDIAVRCGSDRDIFFCYAVRANNVYRNPSAVRFGQGHPEWTYYQYSWISPGTLEVKFGGNVAYIVWEPNKFEWVPSE